MRVVQVEHFGGPENLELVEASTPTIGPDEVLIRVRAIGVNFFEVLMRQDRYAVSPDLPFTPGVEVAGVVEKVGASTDIPLGSRVLVPLFAFHRAGGYAEFIKASVEEIIPLPSAVSFEEGVALLVQGLTAYHAVRLAPPKEKVVLVTAASGGVGSLLIQLAKQAGASKVIAAVGSEEKGSLALSLGADVALNYQLEGWEEQYQTLSGASSIDIVYDFVGGDVTISFISALRPGGQLVFGALGRFSVDADDLNSMLAQSQSIKGLALLPLLKIGNWREDAIELLERTERQQLKVVIGGRFPLEQVAEAHRLMESRRSVGKVVLLPEGG